ncbi:MAG: cadmium-translocating P-type ATPase [Candidatus Hydrogenedentota bacterium]|nr:MAG: cadmium-translocating P-type ATPase [Candidatus Hydrogenedentota bacterium]
MSNTARKYLLEGLDCPNCAGRIEKKISAITGGVSGAVNFLEKSVVFDPRYEKEVRKAVDEIEPGVTVLPFEERRSEEREQSRWFFRTGFRITASFLLFLGGLYFRQKIHQRLEWLEWGVFLSAYLLVGAPVLFNAVKNLVNRKPFSEHFLMTIATLGAIAIHQLPEAVGVMLFYTVGEFFQKMAVGRSRRSIKALLDVRPDEARVLLPEGSRIVPPSDVAVGAEIEVRPGERIPLDGTVLEGTARLDTSALTGESVPRGTHPGDAVLAGMINLNGNLRIRVARPFAESSVAKILRLVQEAAGRKAPTERFIRSFAAIYTPIVVLLAGLIAVIPPLLFSADWSVWLYRSLVLLVISCPCALVVSVPLSYFSGLGAASRAGILIKGGQFLDALTALTTVVLDKTGTLTKGVFELIEVFPEQGYTAEEVLKFAALAESCSNHPVAEAILAAAPSAPRDDVEEFEEISGHGIKVKMSDGRTLITGNDRILHRENIPHSDCLSEGTVVYVALEKRLIGKIILGDRIKDDSVEAVAELRRTGVEQVVMLTGDNASSAKGIARACSLDAFYSDLLPEDKVRKVEELKAASRDENGKLAFVGDGINDAPVLALADVGVAMGALGSDAAVESADVVLMNDRVSQLVDAVRIARRIRAIVRQNIGMIMAVKIFFIGAGALGTAGMWEAVFADVGITVIAVFNSIRGLRISMFGEERKDPK